MLSALLPLLLLALPAGCCALAFAAAAQGGRTRAAVEKAHVAALALLLATGVATSVLVQAGGPVSAVGRWLYIDPLGCIFVLLVCLVGLLTGIHSIDYLALAEAEADDAKRCRYYGFFHLFLLTMLLAVTANNIVMMWVAIEATTLGSAFLVGLSGRRESLEAAWKYLVICTVGVAFGLYGTVLVFAEGTAHLADPAEAAFWTALLPHAASLDAGAMRLAFVFVLIGFGTKAGLFPMHAWLPDAHSEAPSPVSALLSGVLLKCALLVIIRYTVLVSGAAGPAFPCTLLLVAGVLSIGAGSLLFYVQDDLKRKLAYSSVENVGLIVFGLGVGGPLGVAAALLHTVNHSLTKALLFCGSGNVLQACGTRDLRRIRGLARIAPATALMLAGGALALGGLPPFGIFVSKFLLVTAAVQSGFGWLAVLCLLLFAITLAALLRLIGASVLGPPPDGARPTAINRLQLAPMAALLALVLLLGLYVPSPVQALLEEAAAVVTQAAPATATLRPPWQGWAAASAQAR